MIRGKQLFVVAILVALLATVSVSAQDECSDRTRPVFGFFRRPASCESLKENGECQELVQEGYCLKTCGACGVTKPVSPTAGSQTSDDTEQVEEPDSMATESSVPAPEPDEDEKKASEYQEKLLDEVASIEDGENSKAVEVLPTLTMAAAAPAEEPVEKPKGPAPKAISCNLSALQMIRNNTELSTMYQAVKALNLSKVFENPDIQYTLFAPVDTAWDAAAESLGTTVDDILEQREVLMELVFSGIISDMIVDADAVISSQTLDSQSGAVLFFKYDDGYQTEVISRFGTGTVIDTYTGCNYLIHTIDGVLAETVGKNGTNPDFTESMKG